MEADELGLRSPVIQEIGMRVRFTVWLKENLEITKENLVDRKRPKSRLKSRLKSELAAKVVIFLEEGKYSKSELAEKLGHTSLSGELHKQIRNLLDMEYIEMTIPEKPKSSKQKYRLTRKGKDLLDN